MVIFSYAKTVLDAADIFVKILAALVYDHRQ